MKVVELRESHGSRSAIGAHRKRQLWSDACQDVVEVVAVDAPGLPIGHTAPRLDHAAAAAPAEVAEYRDAERRAGVRPRRRRGIGRWRNPSRVHVELDAESMVAHGAPRSAPFVSALQVFHAPVKCAHARARDSGFVRGTEYVRRR
jgi:hypothetical protein